MATLQQLDMNILLWIQEHLRVDALTPFWRAVTFLGNGGWFWIVLCVLLICFRENTQNRSDSGTLAAVRVSDHKSADKKCSSPSKTF